MSLTQKSGKKGCFAKISLTQTSDSRPWPPSSRQDMNSIFKVHSIECQDASFYIINIGSTSRTTLTSGRLIIDLFSSHKLLRNRWSGLTSKPFKRICHRYFFAILKSGASMGPNISRDLDRDLFFCFNVLQRSPMV